MEKTKVCPKCLKEQNIKNEKCEDCGFEFYVKEEETEVTVSSNTVVINDRTPIFLWKLISFLLPPVGFVFYVIWREKWSNRSKASGVMALTMSIVWFFVGIIYLIIAYGIKYGSVLV